MSDERIRELERRYRESGTREDYKAWLQERVRGAEFSRLTVLYESNIHALYDVQEAEGFTGHPLFEGKPRPLTLEENLEALIAASMIQKERFILPLMQGLSSCSGMTFLLNGAVKYQKRCPEFMRGERHVYRYSDFLDWQEAGFSKDAGWKENLGGLASRALLEEFEEVLSLFFPRFRVAWPALGERGNGYNRACGLKLEYEPKEKKAKLLISGNEPSYALLVKK